MAPVRPTPRPSWSDHHMLAKHNSRLGEAVEQTVVDHRLGTFRGLFAGLEDRHHCPAPSRSCLRQQRRCANKPGYVHVVTTHVPTGTVLASRSFALTLLA